MFKYFEPNKVGKDYVCGDIHGCYTALYAKLKDIGFDICRDRLFPVGDYTDRGPESEKALDFLKKSWVFPIMGNHEDIVLQCHLYNTAGSGWHFQNGGEWWLNTSEEFKKEYFSVIKDLPLAIQVGDFGIVHSRVPEGVSWEELSSNPKVYEDDLLWARNNNMYDVEGIHCVFAGHTIHDNIVVYGNVIDIDTGGFLEYWDGYDGHITIVELEHEEE